MGKLEKELGYKIKQIVKEAKSLLKNDYSSYNNRIQSWMRYNYKRQRLAFLGQLEKLTNELPVLGAIELRHDYDIRTQFDGRRSYYFTGFYLTEKSIDQDVCLTDKTTLKDELLSSPADPLEYAENIKKNLQLFRSRFKVIEQFVVDNFSNPSYEELEALRKELQKEKDRNKKFYPALKMIYIKLWNFKGAVKSPVLKDIRIMLNEVFPKKINQELVDTLNFNKQHIKELTDRGIEI